MMHKTSPLLALTHDEWENICDGCGRCCLVKLQDDETEEIYYTDVACEFLNPSTCRCADYQNRSNIKPQCMVLNKHNLSMLEQMPYSCAYRAIHEARFDEKTDKKSLRVTGRIVSELYVHEDQLPQRLIDWVSVKAP